MRSARARRTAWAAFALAIVLQLVALYYPSPPGVPGVPGLDKLVHASIFLLPAMLGVVAGIRPLWLGSALVAHAVISEVVQQLALPERSGDAWDAVADVIGVAIGLALGVVIRRRLQRATDACSASPPTTRSPFTSVKPLHSSHHAAAATRHLAAELRVAVAEQLREHPGVVKLADDEGREPGAREGESVAAPSGCDGRH